MPVDFITIPAAIIGALMLLVRLIVFRSKAAPRPILVLNWVLLAPFFLMVVVPLVALHVFSLFGSTGAMTRLGGLYQSGFNGNFMVSESMSLHYYDEAIASGSVEAMLLKSQHLEFDVKRRWINSQREFIGNPDSPMYKSKEWIEAFDLANKAAEAGKLEAVHMVHKMSLLPNPRAYGEGVYLIQHSTNESRRRYVCGTREYELHLYQSDGWKQGMRVLREESADPWVRDFYFIALIAENAAGGNDACRRLKNAFRGFSDDECLGAERARRAKIADDSEWRSALRILETSARTGDATAADMLSRAREFATR